MATAKKNTTTKAAPKTAPKKKIEEQTPEQENNRPEVKAQIDKMVDIEGSKVKAYASATIGGAYAVHGIRVMDSEKGLYVAMPARSFEKNGKTEYAETFHPVSADARNDITNSVMQAYEQKMQEELTEDNAMDMEEDLPFEQKM